MLILKFILKTTNIEFTMLFKDRAHYNKEIRKSSLQKAYNDMTKVT